MCVYTDFISTLKMLFCTVELDFFFLLKRYFCTYKVVIGIYFKGARLNFVTKLKWLSCIPVTALMCFVVLFF